MRQPTTPARLRRSQPELEMLPLDVATLRTEDGEINAVAAHCGALRRDGRLALAERLSDALLRMLAARFGGDEAGAEHTEELRRALRHMEEPRMLAETVTQWCQKALDQGRRQGVSEGQAAGRVVSARSIVCE